MQANSAIFLLKKQLFFKVDFPQKIQSCIKDHSERVKFGIWRCPYRQSGLPENCATSIQQLLDILPG